MIFFFTITDDEKLNKVRKSILEICERDAKCIKTCIECFEYWVSGNDDFFAMACSKPHLLVFAKVEEYPHWPAKVMEINGNTALVEFFGDHTQADVPLKSCFLYSESFESQNRSNDAKIKRAFDVSNIFH